MNDEAGKQSMEICQHCGAVTPLGQWGRVFVGNDDCEARLELRCPACGGWTVIKDERLKDER